MKSILSADQMKIEANVIANAKEPSIQYLGDNKLKVKVKAKAEAGKANAEILSLLSKTFNCSFQIINGLKSKNKLFLADCDEKKFLEIATSLKSIK